VKAKLTYVIKFVADMDKAVKFHRDTLGLPLKFQSPEWSELATGDVTLALHKADARNPAGTVRVGFGVDDLKDVYAKRKELGIEFISEPRSAHGSLLAAFRDQDGGECSISSRG
jgi:catechol 2,3-dioxygenase-like lactoylglutathione lyase family enzyme